MWGRAWSSIKEAVDGLKTLGVAAVFFVLGLADYLDLVNAKAFLDLVLGEDKSAKIMVLLPVIFAVLRFVSTGAPRWTKQWKGDKIEEKIEKVEAGAVDECNQKGNPY